MKDEGGMTKFKSIFRVPVNIQLEMRGWDRDGVTKQQQQPPVTLLTLGFSFSAEKQRHGDMVLRPGAGTYYPSNPCDGTSMIHMIGNRRRHLFVESM